MKPVSFVHVADSHLGYAQYGLEARRKDFTRAFEEAVERALELKPDFALLAGDLFNDPRPTNPTLEEAIACLKRLRDAGIKVFAVDGSHDVAPNVITGTILSPLDKAGLLHYLPRHEGSCWNRGECYIYGVPSFPAKLAEQFSSYLGEIAPKPRPNALNVFLFHGAVDHPAVRDRYRIAPELKPELLPDGFDYYAGGHVHQHCDTRFKDGYLAYSGCLESTSYEEAEFKKGFYYVEARSKDDVSLQWIELEFARDFVFLRQDFSGRSPVDITKEATKLVKNADRPNAIIVLVMEGLLPSEARKAEVDVMKIKKQAVKALHVRVVNNLKELGMDEILQRIIFETSGRDVRSKAYDYFLKVFGEEYDLDTAKRYAKIAIDLLDPLLRRREGEVRKILESI